MKTSILFVFLLIGLIAYSKGQDVDRLLKNRVYVNKQISCVLERGPCDAIGRRIKDMLPHALFANCHQCTPTQKKQTMTLRSFMQRYHPNEWNAIIQLYSTRRPYYRS